MMFTNTLPSIDEIFNSVGRVRILNILAVKDQMNITAITKISGLNHTSVRNHLSDLQKMNIVEEQRFGRIKIFRINPLSSAGKRIKEFLKHWYRDSLDQTFEIQ